MPVELGLSKSQSLFHIAPADIQQTQAAERQRCLPAQLRSRDVDELQAAAPEISCHAIDMAEPHEDSLRSELRLALARQKLDREATRLLGPGDELGTVLRIANGGRRHSAQPADAKQLDNRSEPPQGGEGTLDSLCFKLSCCRDRTP